MFSNNDNDSSNFPNLSSNSDSKYYFDDVEEISGKNLLINILVKYFYIILYRGRNIAFL